MATINTAKQRRYRKWTGAVVILAINATVATGAIYAGAIKRVEPPFWWAGMRHQQLQLMVYGEDLAGSTVSSSSQRVKVTKAYSLDNPSYLFISLRLDRKLTPGGVTLTLTRERRRKTIEYEFKPRKPASAERQGFASRDVIYLVTPDRFANGDPHNDAVPGLTESAERSSPDGRHGGDLQGITQNLNYLQTLGVSKIWLNPLQENNEPQYSYHGYSISDLYNIDARLGGKPALLALSSRAAQYGIGLIMDTIPNHIGVNHWWMSDLPSRDWINNQAVFAPTSHRRETIQDPHAAEQDRYDFNDAWFVPSMPDLNQRREELATYLIQNNIWWVEYADLSGLRVDTLPYADKQFTARFSRALLAEYPKLTIVGEEWSSNPAIVSYWQRGKVNRDGFRGGVPSLMDFPLQKALIQAINEQEGWDTGLIRLYQALANDFQYPNPDNLVIMADNHDMSRMMTQLHDDEARLKMALSILMTLRGIPQIFYGTEIGMSNTGSDKHGVIRSDFPGGWPTDTQNAFTGKNLSERQQRILAFTRTLLNWRKGEPLIHSGRLTHFAPRDGVYVYFRHQSEAAVMVVVNKNTQDRALDLTRFRERLIGFKSLRNVMDGVEQPLGKTLSVDPRSTAIFRLSR